MYCTRCGVKLRKNAFFCHKCGQRVKKDHQLKVNQALESEVERLKRRIVSDDRIVALRSSITKKLDRIANQLSSPSPNSSLARLSPQRRQKLLEAIKALQSRLDEKESVEDISAWTQSLEVRIEGTKCLVCLQDLTKSKERILACPHCLYPSHETHITSWLKMKSVCPLCRTEISLGDLIPVKI